MRTHLHSRTTNRYHANGEAAVVGQTRYWGTHWIDGSHDPAEAARIMERSVSLFAARSRRQPDPAAASEDMARAMTDDARRQMAYRDLVRAAGAATE